MPEKKYNFLNPGGIEEEVEFVPLAPRLKSLEGKTIHFCRTGEPDVTIPLEKQLKEAYPQVNWTSKYSATPTPRRLTPEERKSTDAVILAVSW
jgi:hypothetical protein